MGSALLARPLLQMLLAAIPFLALLQRPVIGQVHAAVGATHHLQWVLQPWFGGDCWLVLNLRHSQNAAAIRAIQKSRRTMVSSLSRKEADSLGCGQ